jgi:cytochrome c-type biogenesis protein CcmH/NrfG
MKRNLSWMILLGVFCAAATVFAAAQAGSLGTVKGVCKDEQGNPIADAQLVWHNDDNGRTYTLKTNKKGEYFSLGIEPGKYTVTLSKDGKQLWTKSKENVQVEEHQLDIDIKQQQQDEIQQTAKQHGLTPEQVKEKLEEQQKIEKYNANVKQVNAKIQAATAAMRSQPPNYDSAIASLNDAVQMAPNEGQVWCQLGSVYLDSAAAQTDLTEKAKRYTDAYNDLKKSIDLDNEKETQVAGSADAGAGTSGQPAGQAQAATPANNAGAGQAKKPEDAASLQRRAGCYNNYGSAALHVGKSDEAAAAYTKAAGLDPAHAGNYYFNLGVVLHNSAKDADQRKQAAAAFDKAIAADPNKADAYYLKGTDLIALATADSSGKMTAPDGTAEAFQKYLELQPNGPHAEEAKQMLAALNAAVETGYGKKSTKKK